MSRLRDDIKRAAITSAEIDGEGWLTRTVRFPHDFSGFAGHFPGYAIVPAIVQVLTAQILAESSLDPRMKLYGVENAKFLVQIRPDEEIVVRCRLKPRGEDTAVEARLSCSGKPAASLTLKFSPEGLAS